jgi:hypothetical protein
MSFRVQAAVLKKLDNHDKDRCSAGKISSQEGHNSPRN